MTKSEKRKRAFEDLRRRANAEIRQNKNKMVDDLELDQLELHRVIEDLRLTHVELEIQNNDLIETQLNLQRSRDDYIELFNNAPIGYVLLDSKGTIEKVNQTLSKLLGKDSFDLNGQKLSSFFSGSDREIFDFRFPVFQKNPAGKDMTVRLNLDGKEQFLSLTGRHVSVSDPSSVQPNAPQSAPREQRILVAVQDVTERVRAEYDRALAAQVFETSIEGIMITDPDGAILRVNQAFTVASGYTSKEIVGRKPDILKSGYHDNAFYRKMWSDIKTKGHWQGEVRNRRKNGDIYSEWLTINTVTGWHDEIKYYISIFSDITERKQNQMMMERLAYYDALTGLPNRARFMDLLRQNIVRAQRVGEQVAVLFIDLDDFKELNDTKGHTIGDLLLQQVALRLSTVTQNSEMVARVGGDEFTVILPDVGRTERGLEQIQNLARKILEVLGQQFLLNDRAYYVTASVGIATYPDDGATASELVQHSDMAMYRAKNSGKNRISLFTKQMHVDMVHRALMREQLQDAIRRSEFEVFFQPKVRITDQETVGFEALIRWHHPDQGLLLPDQFILQAEEFGLIVDIGAWVLKEACRHLRRWRDAGWTEMEVSVNLSPHQARFPDFPQMAMEILAEQGIPAPRVVLEVTETDPLIASSMEQEVLVALAQAGFAISLDDFGTGYSSLSYVKRLPVSEIKIDRSFVSELVVSKADRAIVSAGVALADSLNIKTVAEGVETEAQHQLLKELGCEFAQGHLFRPALNGEDAMAFLAALRGSEA